ncbi:MAG: methionyl-tRNA formyltransferase [Microthrixaceae bacterium]
MKLVYFGTPDMAVEPLRALCAAKHDVVLVVTGADTRRGRGKSISPCAVKAAALDLGLEVSNDPLDVLSVDADLGVVVAFGQIISTQLLDHLSMVNLHFSLLPRWRGAAPVERAILAGDAQTGVCLMEVAEGLDTGGIYASETVEIDNRITASELRERLVAVGSGLLVNELNVGLKHPKPQSMQGVTYAHKLHPTDSHLNWGSSSEDLLRVVRVGNAWSSFRHKRFKVISAISADPEPSELVCDPQQPPLTPGTIINPCLVKTGDSWIELLIVQPEGKAAMGASDWARGAHPLGEVLGQ